MLWDHQCTEQAYAVLQVDLAKAYDSIRHQELLDTLAEFGLPLEFSTLVADSLNGLVGRIWLASGLSPQFRVRRGIRQGCPLPPLLFALVVALKMRHVSHVLTQHHLKVGRSACPPIWSTWMISRCWSGQTRLRRP